MEEVEVVDGANVLISKKCGRIQAIHVHSLPPGQKYKVNYNKHGQFVRKGAAILCRYIGDLVRKDNLIGMSFLTWKEVPKQRIAEVIRFIREKIHIAEGEPFDKLIKNHLAKKFSDFKYRLKNSVTSNGTYRKQHVLTNIPFGVGERDWKKHVDYWYSDAFKNSSMRGKAAQAMQLHFHVTGSMNFARKRHQLEKDKGRQIGSIEFFTECYKKKDGSYVQSESREYVAAATNMVLEKTGCNLLGGDTIEVEQEVHLQLRGPDNKGRVKGYGLGLRPSCFYLQGVKTNNATVEVLKQEMTKLHEEYSNEILNLREENGKQKEELTAMHEMQANHMEAMQSAFASFESRLVELQSQSQFDSSSH